MFGTKPLLRFKWGQTTRDIGDIGVYISHVFFARYGFNQIYFHHLPHGDEGKYTLVLEILFSPLLTCK